VVGETTEIGNHVKMYQGVGLVAKSLAAGQLLRGQKRHPTIEDKRHDLRRRDNHGRRHSGRRGQYHRANVFLTSSVPAHSLVVQEEANVRVMSKKDRVARAPDF
jgi:serine O-acetyltransferase